MPTDTVEAPVAQPAEPEQTGSSAPPTTEASTPPVATPEAQEAPQGRTAEADPLAGIDAHDPKTLLERHPGLQRLVDSKAGEIKSRDLPKLREELRAEIRAQIEQEAEDARLAQLAESDDAYGVLEVVKQRNQTRAEREQAAVAQQREAARLAGLAQEQLGQTVVKAFGKLPDPVKAVLHAEDGSFKNFAGDGTAEGGLAEAIQAAITAGVEAEIKTRSKTLRAEIEAAVRQELGAAALEAEPAPDTRGTTGAAVHDDTAFVRAYARGESNDHARWQRVQSGL